jgi:hypothetical protein
MSMADVAEIGPPKVLKLLAAITPYSDEKRCWVELRQLQRFQADILANGLNESGLLDQSKNKDLVIVGLMADCG